MSSDGRDTRLAVWSAFLRAHAAVTAKLERDLVAERDLPLGWYEVLLHLDASGGALRMQELARSVLLSKSGLTRLVDRVEAAGLVGRRACASDRRGVWVELTDAGRARLRDAAPVHLRGIDEHFLAHATSAELAVVGEMMERVAAGADPLAGRGCTNRPDPSGDGVPCTGNEDDRAGAPAAAGTA